MTQAQGIFEKDPDATLDYSVDWTPWLGSDTIDSVEWIVPDGLVKEAEPAPSVAGGKATVWISGGALNQSYAVICRVATTGGRHDDRTIIFDIRKR